MNSRTRWLVFLLVLVAMLALAAPAVGVLSGRNGRIAFTSGRTAGDATAQIFLINPNSPIGPGAATATTPLGGQSRHASWSPDRTKLVVANGTPGSLATENYDLFVKDFVNNTITPLDATETFSNDHPAWSPDGTRIAYEHQPAANSTERDIKIKTVGTAAPAVNLSTAGAAPFQLKAAWSPDSQTVYFAQSPVPTNTAGENFDIVRKVATAAPNIAATNVLATAASEYQPSISPDGTKICYTTQTPQMQNTTEVFIRDLPGGGNPRNISDNPGGGDINCTFSPNGLRVAFSQGIFSQGKLMTESATDNDNAPPGVPLSDDPGSDNFDGNSDWAPDGSPDCPDSTVTTQPGVPITLQLECTDTGPAWERTDPNGFVANDGGPQNGSVSDSSPLTNPSTAKYTPKQFFKGTDRVIFTSFDDFGFGTDTGTVTIKVDGPINGTAGNDTINGTAGNDVINCGGGDDVVNGGGGDDVINCGDGNDQVNGNAGNDQVNGEAGSDLLSGDEGNDRVTGGSGSDRANGDGGRDRVSGNSGNDRVGGDSGRDRVGGDSGRDRVSGGSSNDRVGGGSGNDRVAGNSGNDRVSGGRGNDRVSGGSGNDRVSGDSGRDRVSGSSGRDRLDGGRGRDRCNGGSGRDRARRCEILSRIP